MRQWCEEYHWPKEKSYFFSIYTQEGAAQLAHEFVRRANRYYSIWLGQDDDLYVFSDADRVHEDLDFHNWMVTLDALSPAFAKGNELLGLWPMR